MSNVQLATELREESDDAQRPLPAGRNTDWGSELWPAPVGELTVINMFGFVVLGTAVGAVVPEDKTAKPSVVELDVTEISQVLKYIPRTFVEGAIKVGMVVFVNTTVENSEPIFTDSAKTVIGLRNIQSAMEASRRLMTTPQDLDCRQIYRCDRFLLPLIHECFVTYSLRKICAHAPKTDQGRGLL
jgi:hypothetical protein